MSEICINERLRELRVKSGYTQYQIAKILNIDRSTYSYYEIGKTMPDINVLMNLSRIFNIPINELLADEKSPESVSDSGNSSSFIQGKKNSSHIYELSNREKELVGFFRVCTPEEQEKILQTIKTKYVFNKSGRNSQNSD
ncbi:helix-turn-helix domain-containing protein [Caproiciproducens sp. LBM24188]|nr:helix-turn-helix domain-containing protein [Oscillospiraceae bacterium]HHV33037.1 helix-turn-helix domain-containing protein [Clostridiales bacterium]